MTSHKADIVICGAGIAGLWLFNRLKAQGYDALLLEKDAIGCGQTIASQGIIHSGLKYAFAGQINTLAKSISSMPELWRVALAAQGPVDISAARVNSNSQYLLIPPGFMGGLIAMVTKKALGGNVRELKKSEWPEGIAKSGFGGTVIFMDEPVLDVESVVHALATPYHDSIRRADILNGVCFPVETSGNIERMVIGDQEIVAQRYIFTAAGANEILAGKLGHAQGLKTQHRPLLMGLMHNAPYEMYAHCVGASEKPVMTVTTHRAKDGSLIWYLGGNVSERASESDPKDVYAAAMECLKSYMPAVDLSKVTWSTWPQVRVEGKSDTHSHLPDTPTMHTAGNAVYCWPTKLTFAPMLANQMSDKFREANIAPSGRKTDWSFLPACPFTSTPWDTATWTDAPLARRA